VLKAAEAVVRLRAVRMSEDYEEYYALSSRAETAAQTSAGETLHSGGGPRHLVP
jgi:hypothetical protein